MTIKVKELLKRKGDEVWAVGPDATVFSALELMAEKNIGAVLVVDDNRLLGIFSERDYARKGILAGRASKETVIKDLMTSKVITVDLETSVTECLTLMTESRVRHLPVVDGGKLRGILTIGDVVKHIIQYLQITVRDLENYITGSGYGGQ